MSEKEGQKSFKDKSPLQKAWSIISTTLVTLFAILAVGFLSSSITMKVSGHEAMTFGDTEVRLVLTESMTWGDNTPDDHKGYQIRAINRHDAVFIKKAPSGGEALDRFYASLQKGDVATIDYVEAGTKVSITHRIIFAESYGNGYHFILQGDNFSKGTPGTQHVYTQTDRPNDYPLNSIVGKVTGTSSFVGGFMAASRNKVTIIVLIIAPCAGVIVFELIKIISVINADKKEKLVAEIEAKAKAEAIQPQVSSYLEGLSVEEIEKLRQMLAQKDGASKPAEDKDPGTQDS